jgi:peptide/nickel transport system permease protein
VTPVILWTDALIFVLVAAVIALGIYIRRARHLRAQWHRVVSSRLGAGALVILLAYVAVGLLDSLHFRYTSTEAAGTQYTGEVLSVFDRIVTSLRVNEERTYSAPFATHAYVKETIELPDGREVRDFPRLEHGGAHLADPQRDRWSDVLSWAAIGVLEGLGVWATLLVVMALRRAHREGRNVRALVTDLLSGRTELPWQIILITLAVILALVGAAAELAPRYHILGTDKVGQDVFYQALKSIRTGLVIGTLTTLVMLPFAILLGIMAGYFGGWIDDAIQYVYTTLNSIPGILLIAAAILMLQVYMANHPELFDSVEKRADLRLLFLCIILGITSWTGLCRLLRGESLKLRELEYVQAAVAFGVGNLRIIGRHLLPNVMHIVLISVVLDFSALVLAEAVLSYVEIGVDPTMNSWGNMINSARLEMARDPMVWWSLLAAFLFMFTLVLAANLFADAVRDAFDPRLRVRAA